MPKSESSNTVKRAALLIAVVSNFLAPFTSMSVNLALPQIGKELGLDAVTLDWIITAYVLPTAMLLIPCGRAADIYGRKKIFVSGMFIYMIAALVLTFADSAAMIISFRFVQGIGGAMIFGTGIAIVTSVFPAAERGKALGIVFAAVSIGMFMGPPVGGFLTHYFNWRSIFLVAVPLSLVAIYTAIWRLKGEWAEAKGEKVDYTGSLIYGVALISIIYSFSLLPAISGAVLIIIGILGIGIFLWWEAKCKSPILNLRLFRENRGFSCASLSAFINYSALAATIFLMSLYLQYIKGFSADFAGFIMILQPLIVIILSPVAGRLSDRIEPRFIVSAGMAICAIGLTLFVFLDQDSALWSIILDLVILGVGFSLFTSPNMNAAMSAVETRDYGTASGTMQTMRVLGQLMSMGVAMVIFSIFMGRADITPEYYPQLVQSYRTIFIIISVLCFAGIFVALAGGNVRKDKP
ncbi:MFS transporter [Chloroflexota bacterium]